MKAEQKGNFTEGRMLSRFLQIGAPMMVALLVNVLYSVVDRMYIGHMPQDGHLALAGIGLSFPITMIIAAFQNLCSSGGGPLFSIARGREDREEAQYALGNAYLMLWVIGILLTVAGYALKEPLLWAIGANEDTFSYANEYLSVYLIGTVFVLTSLGMNPFINAQGASKTGMLTVLLGAVVNIILDPVLIYGFDMGVRGAALASVIAQAASCVWVHVYLLNRRTEFRITLASMHPQWELIRRMLTLGLTGFSAQFTNSAVSMIYNAQLSALGGTVWVTVMTVVTSVREIVMMPVHGFTSGAQPVLGYNYGAGREDRVREGIRIMSVCALGYQTVVWIMMMLLPEVFIRLFNNDPALLESGAIGLRIFFGMAVFFALQMSGQSIFVALGKTKQSVFFSLFRKVFLVIPLALILPQMFGLGVKGVFLSEPVSDVVGGAACYIAMIHTVYNKLSKTPVKKTKNA